MKKMFAVDALAVDLCQAIRTVRKEHRAWVTIDEVQQSLGADKAMAVNAAVAFAAAKGWLAIGGAPAHSLLLNLGAP